ncbi:MAG: RNA polymerase sigma factor region1.1 domain-containing protein, partial [bacterium]
MSETPEAIKPLVKRGKVKGSLSLDDISDFLEGKDLSIDEVLAVLEDEGIDVKESSSGIPSGRNTSKNSLQHYFQEISDISLLDPEEEIELSKQVHENRDKIKELCQDYDIDPEEEEDFFETITKSTNDELIRDRLRDRGITGHDLSGFMQRLNKYREKYQEAHSKTVEA